MIKPNCLPLAIGSFPQKNAADAVSFILRNFKDIPLWPQLPQISFKEQMYLQYSKGLPGLVIDSTKKSFYVSYDENIYEKIAEFFEGLLSNPLDFYAVTEDFSAGFNEFMKQKEKIKNLKPKAVKGHISGPVSLALGLLDQDKKPLIYHEEYMDVINQLIIKKSQWQIEKLKQINDNVIYFLDEPYLSSIGSGMLSLDKGQIKNHIASVAEKIKEFGALTGLHCCGDTDWSFIMDLGIDIISFDAYNSGESLLQHTDALREFIMRGGIFAWGIVPSNKEFETITVEGLIQKMYKYFTILIEKGFNIKDVLRNSFITPSCGMGSADEALAGRVVAATLEISARLKKEYGV